MGRIVDSENFGKKSRVGLDAFETDSPAMLPNQINDLVKELYNIVNCRMVSPF